MINEKRPKIVTLLSGGIDSSIMALLYKKGGFDQYPLFIDYGQRATEREWISCKKICSYLDLRKPKKISISSISKLHQNLLTNKSSVEKSPFFPFRNLILVSIGALYAYGIDFDTVAIGIIGRGAMPFPDCSRDFIFSISKSLSLSVNSKTNVLSPFLKFSKEEVICYGAEHGFPYELTYSCYLGRIKHCGRCAACVSRRKAFKTAGEKDPTEYDEI